jgi:hypothetical protein
MVETAATEVAVASVAAEGRPALEEPTATAATVAIQQMVPMVRRVDLVRASTEVAAALVG